MHLFSVTGFAALGAAPLASAREAGSGAGFAALAPVRAPSEPFPGQERIPAPTKSINLVMSIK
jgi:hypothetical protein